MKHIVLVLVFCIVGAQDSLTKRVSDREHNGFVSPVKKVSVEWSPISGSNYPAGSRCRHMTDIYDQTGRLKQHFLYSGACGDDETREDYTYAQDGSRTSKSEETQVRIPRHRHRLQHRAPEPKTKKLNREQHSRMIHPAS